MAGPGALPNVIVDDDVAPARAVGVQVTPLVVPDATPPLAAWQVVVATPRGEWRETFGSEDQLRAFVRGVRAGAAALGCFDVQESQ